MGPLSHPGVISRKLSYESNACVSYLVDHNTRIITGDPKSNFGKYRLGRKVQAKVFEYSNSDFRSTKTVF